MLKPTGRNTLVTGGAGFIGSHLVDRLLKDGHTVTVIDNFATGRMENIAHHKDDKSFHLLEANVADLQTILPVFRDVDWVFHLAALADIVPSIERPLDYHQANVDGTVAVLEAARCSGIKRFIYSASSSCYGIVDVLPTSETEQIRPMYPYALTKYLGEQYVLHYNQVYQMPCVSLRFFNVYGPRTRTSGTYGAVFGIFLAQKLAGKPFTVVGDGTQTRDFTFVADVVDCLVMAAESSVDGEIFNVGSGGTYSVNRIVELLGGEVVHIPKRPGEPEGTFADVTKVEQKLGWRPKVRFEDGVRIMLENIDYWRQAPVWDPKSISVATRDWFLYMGGHDTETKSLECR